MKKFLLIAMAVMMGFASFADGSFSVNYSQSSDSERQLSFTLGEYSIENTVINGQNYSKIIFDHSVVTREKGWAELPFLNSSVQISNQKNVSIDVANSEYVDITLDYPLVPSRGTIYRNQDPNTIPYEIDPASVNDSWYPKSIASADEPFILRDVRGTNVKVYPFQYNAANNTLRVYTEITVNVNDNNSRAINPKTRTSVMVLQEMDAMYNSMFVNYADYTREALPIGNFGDILVITTERDEDALQPFIDWKMEKGFNVYKEVVATGTNVKSLIQESYDNNPDIMYVQLSGDWADIKSDLGGGANAPMDPMMGCVEGTDWYPEIAIGRFSGSSPAHITIQVDKAINYEKNPEVGGEWYTHALSLGSNDGSGGDDGEKDWAHTNVIYDNKLEPFSYTTHTTAYDPGANSGMVANAVNDGISIANYCGHGSENSWVTSGFSNSHIASLTNENRLPILFSVACVNGAFHSGECFAEAWLKKENGGAVMALMATINQPWNPPMRGQDYFNDILTGGYDYATNPGNGTSTEEGRTFLGSIVVNGLNLMYAEASQGEDLETVQTWTTFGDCALQPRTMAPAELSLSSETIISGIAFSTTVTSDGTPMPGAMVAISQAADGLYYSAIADENGEVTIEHELLPGDAKLVVTAMNTQTIYETVQIISPEGPYMVIEGFEVNTDDGLVMYDSEISMDVAFKNLGADPATAVTVTITSENDDYCTLLSAATITLGDVDADEMITMEDAFSFAIADNAPDQYMETLTFEINGTAKDMWEDNVSFKINAPALNIVFAEIDDAAGDGNGRLDAGETAILKFNANNNGHAGSPEANMTIATSSPYITINTSAATLGALDAAGTAMAEFEITVADDAPLGELANFSTDLSAGNYSTSNSIMLPLGLVIEDWETGDFTQYEWTFSGNADWTIIEGSDVYEGTYSAKSGTISHNQSSSLEIEVSAASESLVSFYSKVSSEGNYDFLKFFIDNTEMDSWSGTEAWGMHEYTCPAGEHTLKWSYSKDGSASSGSDCAWVDYIVLPGASSSSPLFADFAADQQDVCDGEMVEFSSNSVGAVTTYSWTFEGGEPATSTDENPTVVYATAGVYNVSLTIGDGTNENTMTKEAYITTHNCTGLGDVQAFNMEVYPNPNNGQFTIKLNQSAKVEIISAVGHTVYSNQLIGKEMIDLSSQAEGVYFVKVETETESKVEKVVVRK
ncbi:MULTISPECIES: C25 family cysteine peptidase [unclassified Lentimicrobium]|uniref:C25 family cysteine peptidase n=1 Tax=unclassified Lentimicrobium TaxID=2677434 RepID=UPI0015526A0C|nr:MULTISPECIES: C25 family cysteine peptidase [unclassified Lentimicrobium]NPD46065.1 T9SS type A sorting domain-containing protein [Lentimicrobium sp. S6]NPD84969.1 T9SS type A sorting domain-containing protein [Lentimicrobium sp. L6]